MKRLGLIARVILLLGIAAAELCLLIYLGFAQQSLLSSYIAFLPVATPSPTPTPPAGTTVGPSDIGPGKTYTSLANLIGVSTGQQFNFKCGTYYMNPGVLVGGTGDTGIVTVPANDNPAGPERGWFVAVRTYHDPAEQPAVRAYQRSDSAHPLGPVRLALV
jgi:hypothetical protein